MQNSFYKSMFRSCMLFLDVKKSIFSIRHCQNRDRLEILSKKQLLNAPLQNSFYKSIFRSCMLLLDVKNLFLAFDTIKIVIALRFYSRNSF